jgi:histidyl-tRNA synthetase
VGFAIGMERLLDLWDQTLAGPGAAPAAEPECDVYVAHQGEAAQRLAARVAEDLREAGHRVLVHAGAGGFKAQFKRADASGARLAVILGDDEVANQEASVKFLRGERAGEQRRLALPDLIAGWDCLA